MYKYLGDTGIKMYDLFNLISIIALLIMNMSQIKYKKDFLSGVSQRYIRRHFKKDNFFSKHKTTIVAVVEMFFISLVQYGFVSVFTQHFGDAVGTGNNYFAVLYFVPFILMLFFYIIKISPLKQLDMITPAYPLALVFVKIACFCSGCCRGMEYEAGLYNADTGLIELPIQLAESALALLIFIFIMIYRKKSKEGTLYPVYLIAYSGLRFFIEFFRAEENIFLIFKVYHILCIVGVTIGIIEFIAVQKYSKEIIKCYNNRRIKERKHML